MLTSSGDASLKRLLVTPGELAPAFDPETYEYSVSVPHVQDFIYFVTELSNEYASVSGAGE
ncbi:MAG: cadherin-like beta sandwich domain-containing protein [Dysgonamonadaceae bacterium]|nr:cadherin-like beta sandwich domain-containing protein [Dysgonamonadaceae bacterium]